MNDDMSARRGTLSLLVLLGLVLAVTLQLVTGFLLEANAGIALLSVHIAGGVAATVLLAAEWLWLLTTHAGRTRLAGFVAAGSGVADWSDGAFLLIVTATVVLGLLLAAAVHGGPSVLPFGALLRAHRVLAIVVAALYLLHGATAMYRRRRARA